MEKERREEGDELVINGMRLKRKKTKPGVVRRTSSLEVACVVLCYHFDCVDLFEHHSTFHATWTTETVFGKAWEGDKHALGF